MSDHKAVPVSPSSLIPVGGDNFASMNSVAQLRSMCASGAAHRAFERSQGILTLDDNAVGRSAQTRTFTTPTVKATRIVTGVQVLDTVRRRKGIVIKAKAGYTKKTNTPAHRIADANGDSWLAKESDLKIIF